MKKLLFWIKERMYQTLRKHTQLFYKRLICLMLVGVFSLIACSLPFPQELTKAQDKVDEDELFNEAVDSFFAAVDNRDAEAIKEMFSLNAKKEDTQLTESIEQLLAFYPGPTERCERTQCGTGALRFLYL